MSNLLIEIGTEELPLDALDAIYGDLAHRFEALLLEHRIDCDKVRIEATPRRIALFVENLAARQRDQKLEFSGPSYEKAYENGNPTKALEGFLRSKNAVLDQVEVRPTPKGKFVFLMKEEKGKSTAAILPKLLEEIPSLVVFPKSMRWEKSGFRFPRPIRWIVALLDKKILPFSMAGVKAGNQSHGHRFLGKDFKILSADWDLYQKLLKNQHVILSLEKRQALIRSSVDDGDQELVRLNAQLIEEPYFIEGNFSKDYLKLPYAVLATVMKKHQKIFAVYEGQQKMTNRFVAVLNGKRKNLTRIKADFENVLESRLKDALYFYQSDTKQPLESKVQSLDQIVYLGKLGTMKAKAHRLEELAHVICGMSSLGDLDTDLVRAAHLCKADLLTHLVYEMPELQGTAGREYALKSGEKKAVAEAIGTQYLPKNMAEDYQNLPKQITLLGAMLGIIDRYDLLVGAFGIGLEPSGSQDPYALRRAGGILVKLIRAFKIPFLWKNIAVMLLDKFHQEAIRSHQESILEKLKAFLQDRILFELQASSGTREYEIAQAVFKASFEDLTDVFLRYEIMSQMFRDEKKIFSKVARVIERTANILKGTKGDLGPIQAGLFKEPMEQNLFRAYEERGGQISKAIDKKEYGQATRLFADIFSEPLNEFFEKVMVNVEDTEVRRNRQVLMKSINQLYTVKLADLSVLSRIEEQ